MANRAQLSDCLIELALQRNLVEFENMLKRTMALFELSAWACIFPPSFQAGGRPLFIAHGVSTRGELLQRASRDGLASLELDNPAKSGLLEIFASELAPAGNSLVRIFKVTRDRSTDLLLFVFRPGSSPAFTEDDIEMLGHVGRCLDRSFVRLGQQQEQEFQAGLFRLVSSLFPEGLCVLDSHFRVNFENRNFREHMLLWTKGKKALQNLNLPKQTILPAEWIRSCNDCLLEFKRLTFQSSPNRMVVTQGPLFKLRLDLSETELIEGTLRYLAFQSSLGVRPYLLLTSSRQERSIQTASIERVANEFGFSRRERQLAELILEGRSSQEIGKALGISITTVKTHVRSILSKSGTKTRLQFSGLCRQPT